MSLKTFIRRFIPVPFRQLVSELLLRILGSHGKSIWFRNIDKTPLSVLSKSKLCEPELKLLPLFVLKPGSVFDVGANRGEYTYVLEKIVGPQNTYAIEPLPHLYRRLRILFPRAHVLKMALSDESGKAMLKTPIIDGSPMWTRSTLERFMDVGETAAVFEEVPILTLDQFCERQQLRDVRLIKVDVEGHEKRVLLGALNILRMNRPVLLIEIEQRHHAEPITELFCWIQAQGYCGLFFDLETLSLRPIGDFSVGRHQQLDNLGSSRYINNFFFLDEKSTQPRIDLKD